MNTPWLKPERPYRTLQRHMTTYYYTHEAMIAHASTMNRRDYSKNKIKELLKKVHLISQSL